jgi:glucuronate isomerase
MRQFMDKDFLLQTDTARMLFHEHADSLPIIDYHCHLVPKMITDDYRFRSITELWLGGDHYKWRAMRANGVNEKYITGSADDWSKFQKWAETIPYTFRNPLYHWTHLELKTAFGIDKILNPGTAREIYDQCNEMIQQPEFSARNLMRRYKVETVCTTDDPTDSLQWHEKIHQSGFEIKVLPTWRPDKIVNITTAAAYREYIDRLAQSAGTNIHNLSDLIDVLQMRHDFFETQGCRLADHGMGALPYTEYTDREIETIFSKIYDGKELDETEKLKYSSALLTILAEMNYRSGWVQQFHYGPLRNNNTKMFQAIGADTGFDSMGDFRSADSFSHFLDRLNSHGKLTKTIVYNLNPVDNDMIAAMMGNFQDGSVPGKMQFGAAWWFNDHIDGMKAQMDTLSRQGLLSRFVGMLTDSRSFLSYPRHEYFRRILCNMLGDDVENGLIPQSEMSAVCRMTEDISYYNAKNYFNF